MGGTGTTPVRIHMPTNRHWQGVGTLEPVLDWQSGNGGSPASDTPAPKSTASAAPFRA